MSVDATQFFLCINLTNCSEYLLSFCVCVCFRFHVRFLFSVAYVNFGYFLGCGLFFSSQCISSSGPCSVGACKPFVNRTLRWFSCYFEICHDLSREC